MLQRVLLILSLFAASFLPGCGGGGGTSADSSATTTAASGSTPTITSQPTSQTVTVGASVTFSVVSAANAFIATLSSTQQSTVVQSYA